jgi:hypothetical protein
MKKKTGATKAAQLSQKTKFCYASIPSGEWNEIKKFFFFNEMGGKKMKFFYFIR